MSNPEIPVILVVEDNEVELHALTRLLEGCGYQVRPARDGVAALAALNSERPPCLILLDLMLPEVNGWEFLRAVRSHPERQFLPVILLTGLALPTEQAGQADWYFQKPYNLDLLLRLVTAYCDRPGRG